MMDFIKFNIDPTNPTHLKNGQLINGITKATWIERYRDNGEFKLVAPVSSGLRTFLPEGTFITHLDTDEVMVVENHEIVEESNRDSTLTISGRSVETFLEQRAPHKPAEDYVFILDYNYNHAKTLIEQYTSPALVANPLDGIDGIRITTSISNTTGMVSAARNPTPGTLYQQVVKLLEFDDLGIKTIRPGRSAILGANSPYLEMQIHDGIDRTTNVLFSYADGEFEEADYLWSNKSYKNAAFIISTYYWHTVELGNYSGFNRRVLLVDGTDIDADYETQPSGAEETLVINRLETLGLNALASQKTTTIVKPEPPKTSKYRYRRDYNVGDYVTVLGNYDVDAVMRVIAYVEIEDENGETGYPTLSVV